MITSDYQPLWCTSKCRAITCASLDYSRLITGDNSESHFCYDNGLFHQAAVDDEDLNSFDDQTVSTEVSSEDEEEKADLVWGEPRERIKKLRHCFRRNHEKGFYSWYCSCFQMSPFPSLTIVYRQPCIFRQPIKNFPNYVLKEQRASFHFSLDLEL